MKILLQNFSPVNLFMFTKNVQIGMIVLDHMPTLTYTTLLIVLVNNY